jgi:C-terminal processing protease CtpA/Prc
MKQVDDVLYKVDGTNVSGMELDQVFMLVRGMEDTPITLEFGRQGGKYKITL